jgi:hypothetical protein
MLEENFNNTKWVIRSPNSKKDTQYNGQYKKGKHDVQNIPQKIKD